MPTRPDWKERTFRGDTAGSQRPTRIAGSHGWRLERGPSARNNLCVLATAAPAPSIHRFVDDARALVPVGGRARHEWLPGGRTALVLRELDDGRGDLCIAGPRTRALFKHPSGVVRAMVVSFKPGWSASLFGTAANTLTDRIVRLDDVWGDDGAELHRELVATSTVPEALERIASAMAGRQALESGSARLARGAARLLEAGEARIEHVAERLGVTPRHLRRVFTEHVGIGPKEFARTVRLRRALRMAERSRHWSRIAAAAGYYDQAHLIAEFRDLLGLTPSAFVERERHQATHAHARRG